MVARISIAFKTPLKSGDEFICKLAVKKEGIRYIFIQDIYRKVDNKVVIKATVEAVSLVHGRLAESPELNALLSPYLLSE